MEALEQVLSGFKEAMMLLEGDKYVAASWVPVQIFYLWNKLHAGTQDDQPEAVQAISKRLLEDFETR